MRIYLSRVILGIVALIINIFVLSVFLTGLPLGLVPSHKTVIVALAPLDIILAICIVFAGEGYEE